MRWRRALIRFFVFALGGLVAEVLWGALRAGWAGNWNLHGQSSPWMIFDYGLLGLILMPMAEPMKKRGVPLVLRAAVYMVTIFAVEYVSGIFFTKVLGLEVWTYKGVPYNLHGQIMLYSIPTWYALGFVAEYLYAKVDVAAVVWLRGITAEQLLEFPSSDTIK
ncbi:MAG: hypothetical protein GX117_10990 [Candidatus Hydrogenedentes bacterium]|jgi:uncharacterized membrane protein|nr:hypothetical protein [Candidatus Hydrogenedentota bacterium]